MIHRDGDVVTLRVPKAETARVTARLLAEQEVLDLNVEDPPIEDVIELVFAQESRRVSSPPRAHGARARRSPPLDRRLLPDDDADSGAAAVPVPRCDLHVHARDGGRAGHLPRRLDDDRGGVGRHRRRAHRGLLRRLLHRVDARPEHEHRLHALRLGVAHPRGQLSGQLLRPLHPIHYDIAQFAGGKFVWVSSGSRSRSGSRSSSTRRSTSARSRSAVFARRDLGRVPDPDDRPVGARDAHASGRPASARSSTST